MTTTYEGREDEFDLGGGSSFRWLSDHGQIVGLIEHHPKPEDGPGYYCGGYVRWDAHEKAKHQLVSGGPGDEEHLTLSPSLLCRTCGNHGFIRDGKWVTA